MKFGCLFFLFFVTFCNENCLELGNLCRSWSYLGECETNAWVKRFCQKSCKLCGSEEEEKGKDVEPTKYIFKDKGESKFVEATQKIIQKRENRIKLDSKNKKIDLEKSEIDQIEIETSDSKQNTKNENSKLENKKQNNVEIDTNIDTGVDKRTNKEIENMLEINDDIEDTGSSLNIVERKENLQIEPSQPLKDESAEDENLSDDKTKERNEKRKRMALRKRVSKAEKNGDLLFLENEDVDLFIDLYYPYFSPGGGDLRRVTIYISNKRNKAYNTYWINPQGREIKTSTLRPNFQDKSTTFATHIFILKEVGNMDAKSLFIAPSIYDEYHIVLTPFHVCKFPQFKYPELPKEVVQEVNMKTSGWIQDADSVRWGVDSNLTQAIEIYDLLIRNGSKVGMGHGIRMLGEIILHRSKVGQEDFDESIENYDVELAIEYFKKAVIFGDWQSLFQLGWIEEFIYGNKDKADYYFDCAHQKGDELSSLLKAYRYSLADSFTESMCQESIKIYASMAQKSMNTQGSLIKNLDLIRLSEVDQRTRALNFDEQELQYVREQARSGNPHASLTLGQVYLFGLRGVQQNFPQARHHLQNAVHGRGRGHENANAFARNFLAHMAWHGMGTDKNTTTALDLYKKSAALNNTVAMNNLGFMHWKGVGTKKNMTTALYWFEKAAGFGQRDAHYYLGLIYSKGDKSAGLDRDFRKAFEYYKIAADKGHRGSQHQTALAYHHGKGTNKSCADALKYYKIVAEQHHVKFALENARRAYFAERIDESFVLYAKMSEAGFVNGQYNTAWLIKNEELVLLPDELTDRDQRAYYYHHLASKQNDSISQREIGDYFYYNKSGLAEQFLTEEQYKVEAFAMYNLAANNKRKDTQSMFNLAWMYQYGVGVEQNFSASRNWYWSSLNHSTKAFVPSTVSLALMEIQWIYLNFLKDHLNYYYEAYFYVLTIVLSFIIVFGFWGKEDVIEESDSESEFRSETLVEENTLGEETEIVQGSENQEKERSKLKKENEQEVVDVEEKNKEHNEVEEVQNALHLEKGGGEVL